MTSYRLIPLDDTVVFPGMSVTLSVDPGADTRVLLVPRRGDAYARLASSPRSPSASSSVDAVTPCR